MGLNLLVTGAGGFLGQAVVAAALSRGHAVRAMVRHDSGALDGADTQVCDLGRDPIDLTGIDAVIHCAARMTGNEAAQRRDTVAPTKALCDAIVAMPNPPRLVLVSSLSVYDYTRLSPNEAITEQNLLEALPQERDAYTTAKLEQEAIARQLSDVWLIRAGAIYGPGRTWNAHVGVGLGPVLFRIGRDGEIPLVHVTDCARGLVQAAETPTDDPHALNLIGDALPDRIAFLDAHRASGWPRYTVPVPWWIVLMAGILPTFTRKWGLLRPRVLKSRMMPLRYPNGAAKASLDWEPKVSFEAGMAAALEATT